MIPVAFNVNSSLAPLVLYASGGFIFIYLLLVWYGFRFSEHCRRECLRNEAARTFEGFKSYWADWEVEWTKRRDSYTKEIYFGACYAFSHLCLSLWYILTH